MEGREGREGWGWFGVRMAVVWAATLYVLGNGNWLEAAFLIVFIGFTFQTELEEWIEEILERQGDRDDGRQASGKRRER